MVTIERTVTLPVPRLRVWEVASPPARWADWLSLHIAWPTPPPAHVTRGTSFVEQVTVVEIPMRMTWTITEYDAPATFAMEGRAALGVELDVRFALAGDGETTEVVVTAQVGGPLIVGTVRKLAERFADQHLEASLEKLSGLLV